MNTTTNRNKNSTKHLKKSNSVKYLKKTNTSSDGFKSLKRQSSTPNIRSASANGFSNNKLKASASQTKLFKNLNNTKSIQSIGRSSSNGKIKSNADRPIALFNPISVVSNYTKTVKKKSCRKQK